MQPNPMMKKLGLAPADRAVVIHADDIGMCQASFTAWADLVDFGLISSAATMVPCPWFPAVAAYCREHPDVDLGVHLTLTSEWDAYRWGPLSTRDPASGLLDGEGYFPRQAESVQERADPGAVRREMQAQLERALAAGIDVTHIDSHMGTVLHPRFAWDYVQLALQHRLPFIMVRLDEAGYREMGMDEAGATFAVQLVAQLEAQGVPIFDRIAMLPLDQSIDQMDVAKRMFDELPPGLSNLIIHPSADTPELRAITPDWPSRVAHYRAFTSEELRAYVRDSGVQVIGYRALRDLMRQER